MQVGMLLSAVAAHNSLLLNSSLKQTTHRACSPAVPVALTCSRRWEGAKDRMLTVVSQAGLLEGPLLQMLLRPALRRCLRRCVFNCDMPCFLYRTYRLCVDL